jgi:hypothetical protein
VRTNSKSTPPTAEFHLAFLAKIERLLSQGRFTSTYKFALLIALTNIAVERGDDSGDELEIEIDEIARQFLELYWSMARPYPRVNTILKQNREAAKPSRMITILKDEVRHSISSYQRLRVYRASRDGLLSETRRTLAKDVLYRLHTIGNARDAAKTSEQFFYDHPPTAAECAIQRHPGGDAVALHGGERGIGGEREAARLLELEQAAEPTLPADLRGLERGPQEHADMSEKRVPRR